MAPNAIYIVIETHEEQEGTNGVDSHMSAIRAVFTSLEDAGTYASDLVKRLEHLTKVNQRFDDVFAGSYRGTEVGETVGNEVMGWVVYWKGWTGIVVEKHEVVGQGRVREAASFTPIHG